MEVSGGEVSGGEVSGGEGGGRWEDRVRVRIILPMPPLISNDTSGKSLTN